MSRGRPYLLGYLPCELISETEMRDEFAHLAEYRHFVVADGDLPCSYSDAGVPFF